MKLWEKTRQFLDRILVGAGTSLIMLFVFGALLLMMGVVLSFVGLGPYFIVFLRDLLRLVWFFVSDLSYLAWKYLGVLVVAALLTVLITRPRIVAFMESQSCLGVVGLFIISLLVFFGIQTLQARVFHVDIEQATPIVGCVVNPAGAPSFRDPDDTLHHLGATIPAGTCLIIDDTEQGEFRLWLLDPLMGQVRHAQYSGWVRMEDISFMADRRLIPLLEAMGTATPSP